MNRISRNLSIVYRTERLIARRQIEVMRKQTGILAAAGLIGVIGFVMLNMAAFWALSVSQPPQVAALIVALIDLGVAALMAMTALRLSAERELEPATEIRDTALAELEEDVSAAAESARTLSENVGRMARDPLGSALPALLMPLISAFLRSRKE